MPCCLLCHDHVALSVTLPCLALPWLLALPCITLPRGRFAARAHSSRDRDHNAQRPSAPWPRRLRRAPRDETTLKKVWGSSMVYSKQQLGYDGGSGACLRAGKSGPAGRRGGGRNRATPNHTDNKQPRIVRCQRSRPLVRQQRRTPNTEARTGTKAKKGGSGTQSSETSGDPAETALSQYRSVRPRATRRTPSKASRHGKAQTTKLGEEGPLLLLLLLLT